MPGRPVFARQVFEKTRALPRMSWSPENLYNLWQRTEGPLKNETDFTRSNMTLFQQRWRSKRLSRGYHGDHIGQTKFERWYLPEAIPSVHDPATASSSSRDLASWVAGRVKEGGRRDQEMMLARKERAAAAPVGTMLYREVERRLDVLVFRACFAESVWQARQMVVHRKVKVNGLVVNNPNVRLNPGDLFSVDPKAIPMLALPPAAPAVEETEAAEEASPDAEAAPSAPTPAPSKKSPKSASDAAPIKAAFKLPPYAAPFLFIPAYLEPNFKTCSAVYVRHPTARAGYSEIPSPYDAGGSVMSLSWEWFKRKAPNMRKRRDRWMSPERQTDRKAW